MAIRRDHHPDGRDTIVQIGRVEFDGKAEPAIHHNHAWVRLTDSDTPDIEVLDVLDRHAEFATRLANLDIDAEIAAGRAVADSEARLVLPLNHRRSIVAVGLNYAAHADEVSFTSVDHPLLFAKWPGALTGPFDDVVLNETLSAQVDYEVELAAVIGRTAQDVAPEDALEYVAGYMVSNDISARDIQQSESQWTRAKSFNGFCPIGPWITSSDEIPDPQNLTISSYVNGERRQHASTSQMLHPVAEIIAFATRGATLFPGDIIITGTPAGVALGDSSLKWLQPGDVLRCEIEGLGHLENTMVLGGNAR